MTNAPAMREGSVAVDEVNLFGAAAEDQGAA
jgi:hypothetical protein